MNKEQQEKIDEQIDKGNTPPKRFRVVEKSDAPVFTDKLIKGERQENLYRRVRV